MSETLTQMRQNVYHGNIELPKYKLVKFTWGNVSEINRDLGIVVIKPSGVDYEKLTPENMVVTDLEGNVLEGSFNPSSDLQTHLEVYKAWPEIGGIVHTHSTEAVGWAQSGLDIPFLGTTHADYFHGPIPCTRSLTYNEVEDAYEKETGKVIVETFKERKLDPTSIPGVIVSNHGPFTWGKNASQAIYHSVVLEEVAKMNRYTKQINPCVENAPSYIMDKHYLRKHGTNAYYGQQ